MTTILLYSLLYAGMVLGLQQTTPAHWHLVKEGQGIKVYTADTDHNGFKSIKATAVFNGTLAEFKDLLLDIGRQPLWVYGTRQAYLVEKVNNEEVLYYVETNLPWPASNRDAVIRMKLKEDKARRSLTVISTGEPRALPIREGKVRVPHFAARWEAKAAGERKISLTYLLDINPGGSLPPGISNLFISKGPYESFRLLCGLLENPDKGLRP